VVFICCVTLTVSTAVIAQPSEPSVRYIPLEATVDAPPGMFKSAVIVDRMPLVHTRQLFAHDLNGALVGRDAAKRQIDQVIANLQTVLEDSGSSLNRLIRVNVYALSTEIVASFHQRLSDRLDTSVRPAITSVLTPLPHRGALIAVDAVAAADDNGPSVTLRRCEDCAGDDQSADAAVLPAGGIAYLSGHPEGFDLTALPTTKSMARLTKTLDELGLGPEHVVQVKVFLNPMTAAEEVREEIARFFPEQRLPPIVFVEWLASLPI
jgi:enamine deaminase RidA (YjgF/YER057c/UK114 family)